MTKATSGRRQPVRIALLGNGFARTTILPCLRHVRGIALCGIASPNVERAGETARAFGIPFVSSDHREVLSRTDPDLVFVATPPHRHAEMAIDALRAGCHVVCEKPMALDARETARMVAEAAKRPDRLALIDHELRFLPTRKGLVRLLRQGKIGEPLRAEYLLGSVSRSDPRLPWSWWSDGALGGGLWGALGSHAVDALHEMLGPVEEASGSLRTFIRERPDPETGRPRPVTSDDFASATLRFTSGAAGTILLSAVDVERRHELTIQGTEGAVRLREQGPLLLRRRRIARGTAEWREIPCPDPLPPSAELGIPDTDWARAFLLMARAIVHFLQRAGSGSRASERRAPEEVPGEGASFADGHRTQIVLDAVRKSSRTGKSVRLET